MESNKPAIKILTTLVCIVLLLFLAERKFLVFELRGETISNYEALNWYDKVVLLLDDFEGLENDSAAIQAAGFFGYGSAKLSLDTLCKDENLLASKNSMKIVWTGKEVYGGWGKGIGKNFDLNPETDFINFRIYSPVSNTHDDVLKIMLEEDDNYDATLQPDKDDSWFYSLNVKSANRWQFISIPLKDFKDGNPGGDGLLNINRRGGLHTVLFSFEQPEKYTSNQKWYFDFICFTNEKITTEIKK